MIVAWRLGLASDEVWFRRIAGIIFVLGPVPAIVISAAWLEKYDHRPEETGRRYSTRERVLFSLLIPPMLAATAFSAYGLVVDFRYLPMWYALLGGLFFSSACIKIVVTGRSWGAFDRRS
jgi:hypothetical protein